MRGVHSGHATKTEQALLAGTSAIPLPTACRPQDDTGPSADRPAQQDTESEDDSSDDLDDLPDDDTPAAATGFGLYDAYEEADEW
ncbi:hypothetical protein [Streptomyces sp. NPDC001388]|uniref:hypothetical protein n=1 Tax=Streptomyces sp. NPDC001388 TaxID=3364568 RepID=UPI00367DEA4D